MDNVQGDSAFLRGGPIIEAMARGSFCQHDLMRIQNMMITQKVGKLLLSIENTKCNSLNVNVLLTLISYSSIMDFLPYHRNIRGGKNKCHLGI